LRARARDLLRDVARVGSAVTAQPHSTSSSSFSVGA
jgi:hypothetical protein